MDWFNFTGEIIAKSKVMISVTSLVSHPLKMSLRVLIIHALNADRVDRRLR